MQKTFTVALVLQLGAAWACGATQPSSTRDAREAMDPADTCAAFLTTTQKLMSAVLEAIPHVYPGMAGEIVRIQEVKTNVYDVWILQEERTDVVTFETTISPECRATAVRVSERVANSRPR